MDDRQKGITHLNLAKQKEKHGDLESHQTMIGRLPSKVEDKKSAVAKRFVNINRSPGDATVIDLKTGYTQTPAAFILPKKSANSQENTQNNSVEDLEYNS